MDRIWKMSLLIVSIILVDQLTKGAIQSKFQLGESITIIDGLFNFTYVQNPGAAFGFMAKASAPVRKILFLLLPVIACFWLLWLIWVTRKTNYLLCVAYSLILAGAVGNLIDRFSMGYVVDFLDFYWGMSHFPAFNVADSSITIAAFLLIIDLIKESFNKIKAEKEENKEIEALDQKE